MKINPLSTSNSSLHTGRKQDTQFSTQKERLFKTSFDYQKLCEIMMWEQYEGETFEDTFLRQEIKPHELPTSLIIDVVHANGLEGWAKLNTFKSLTDLRNQIIRVFKFSIVDPINSNKKMQELFPPIYNFCNYATKLDRNGRIKSEALKIAESAW